MAEKSDNEVDVEVLVIGAGVIGIYQLYRAREAGFTAIALEAGEGAGGVWFWNRYPGARFDSESYAYGYNFSRDLFDAWRWREEFATQPEIEDYLNFVIDECDLRRDIRFGQRVISATFDRESVVWTLTTASGDSFRARYVVSATGGLSVPHYPEIEGLEDFEGIAHHTGAWPHEPVDFAGKRVAIIGNGPSGSQILPVIADVVEYVDLYQRTPTWCTPLNNKPIDEERQVWLRENFDEIAQTVNTSISGFLHPLSGKFSRDHSFEERQAFYEEMWAAPGFGKLTMNYFDMTTNKEVNDEFCRFLAGKIRDIVKDPLTAERLTPRDHGFGAKRPPFIENYYEQYNKPNVGLVSLKETPIVRVDAAGIETTGGHRAYDIIVYATGFDFGTGALTRMGVRGEDGLDLRTDWADGPADFGGFAAHDLPNFFFPGGPHGAGGGNYPRYGSFQVDFITDTLVYMRANGFQIFEPTQQQQDAWMNMIEELAPRTGFSAEHSHYYGANVQGKARKYLLNPGGRPKLNEVLKDFTSTHDYGAALSSVTQPATV